MQSAVERKARYIARCAGDLCDDAVAGLMINGISQESITVVHLGLEFFVCVDGQPLYKFDVSPGNVGQDG